MEVAFAYAAYFADLMAPPKTPTGAEPAKNAFFLEGGRGDPKEGEQAIYKVCVYIYI